MEAYPLYWPEGWKRSTNAARSAFKTGFGAARNFCLAEIGRLAPGAKVIISSNIPLRNDGMPRANMPEPRDKGVAVYFKRAGKDMVFACDKYDRTWDNIYAIGKTIEAMRGIERWGSSSMLERAFAGFKALPSETAGESWWSILHCPASASREEGEAAFREQARIASASDPSQTSGLMQKLNLARDQMRGATT